VSARIRARSRLKRLLCFVLIDVRCLRVPQVEDHCIKNEIKVGHGCLAKTKGSLYVKNFGSNGLDLRSL
jgi:hypothetical protein